MSEFGNDYDDWSDDDFPDDWDDEGADNKYLDDDDELPSDWDNEDVDIEYLDDNDDDELPDDWNNEDMEYKELENENDNNLPDDWKDDSINPKESFQPKNLSLTEDDLNQNHQLEKNLNGFSKDFDEKIREIDSRIKGNISELTLIKDLLRNDIKTFTPYGDAQHYDLIIENNDKFSRIQVKTGTSNKDGSISFPPFRTCKGEYKSYEGDIEYFGIFCPENNKSYLIPIESVGYDNNFSIFRIGKDDQEKFIIEVSSHINYKKNKSIISKNDKAIQLMKEGKIVLDQLGINKERILIYDDNLKLNEGKTKHVFHEFKISEKNKLIDHKITTPTQKDISKVAVSSDLMRTGNIISNPIRNNNNYDFILVKNYELNRRDLQFNDKIKENTPQFYKVKIIEAKIEEDKIKVPSDELNSKTQIDYYGIYDPRANKSYLIPVKDIQFELKNPNEYLINENKKLVENFDPKKYGEINEMIIAREFMKNGYNVFTPIIDNERYDLVVKKGKFYTVQVKTGRTYCEKDSTYVRFEASFQKSDNTRVNYKGHVDFIAVINRNSERCYLIDVKKLPNTDGKLKLNEEGKVHHGTIWAKDQEFKNIVKIVQKYDNEQQRKIAINKQIHEITNRPIEIRQNLERNQIIDILCGKIKYHDIKATNKILEEYKKFFENKNPKSKAIYQNFITRDFRDFLIEVPELKSQIIEKLKQEGLYSENNNKHQFVYDYIGKFYKENGRIPNTIELYQKFLNFRSYMLRGKLRELRKNKRYYYDD